MWIDSSCFLFSAEQLSQTTSQYSNSSNDFLLTLNFSVRMRFNRTQAFDAISWIWLDHVHDFDKMRPRCLWLSVSGSIMLFMNNGGCCGGSSLRDSTIGKVFRSWKLTNQFTAQVLMVSRSVLIRFTAIWADSTIMYRLVSSANNRIEQPIFFTIFHYAHSFARNWQLSLLNQRKGENNRRKYFMINLHERMLPTSAGVEPATFWSPVGRTSNWATKAGPRVSYVVPKS